MPGKRGRPRTLPVRTEPLSDDEAFWRIKYTTGDSWRATRTIGFCAAWQLHGGTVSGLVEAGVYSRATVYNRLRECHEGGFEPELVRFERGEPDSWMARERSLVEEIKAVHEDAENSLPPWLKRIFGPDPNYLSGFLAEQPD